MKIKTKLTAVSIALAVLPLIIATFTLQYLATTSAREALEEAARDQLISIRATKKDQIEDYFKTISDQVATMSNNGMIINATRDFAASYDSDHGISNTDQAPSELLSYYENQFGKKYAELNQGKSISATLLLEKLNDNALALQHQYIESNPNPMGEKHKLDKAPGASDYSQAHAQYHPPIRQFMETFGYYDVFLTDQTGNVIYSVYKELDFATNLAKGPYADSGLAQAFEKASRLRQNQVAFVDFAPYTPSYESSASFIASPVYDEGQLIGTLIFQMPIGKINAIMTSDQQWQDIGLGDSGETYLVGPDFRARSMSRFLIEDKEGYLSMLESLGASTKVVNSIRATDSNIGLQVIETQGTKAAIGGETGYEVFPDYRGIQVLSAYAPVDVNGVTYGLMSEIDQEEAFASVGRLESQIMAASAIMVLIIAAAAIGAGLVFAHSITSPIVRLSKIMGKVESGNDLTLRADVNSKDEIGGMANAFNLMLEKFEALIQQVTSSISQVATASEELSSVATDSAQNVERQRNETDQVAAAINEMTVTIQEVASNASNASDGANTADNETKVGRQVVDQTSQAIGRLATEIEGAAQVIKEVEQNSENISSVLDVIKSIAEQTNLLALNAAIEAARAGEQGRGFAVVADEVRTLASRTQNSTTEIHEMIDKLQIGARKAVAVMEQSRAQAQEGVGEAENALKSLGAIANAVATISDMNLQIASAAEEQAAVSEEINKNITSISQISELTASGTEQTTAAASELARLATELQELISEFRVQRGN